MRVYHDGVVTEAEEARALAAAAAILAAADVTLRWAHCHAHATADVACTRPLEPGELALRLIRVPRPPAKARAMALGEALLPAQGAPPAFAQLHLERVDQLAERGRADPAVLLGRAIAHELTHLLTGSGRHATTGLMRPIWSAGDVTREHAADWTLDPASVSAVRTRTAASMTLARK